MPSTSKEREAEAASISDSGDSDDDDAELLSHPWKTEEKLAAEAKERQKILAASGGEMFCAQSPSDSPAAAATVATEVSPWVEWEMLLARRAVVKIRRQLEADSLPEVRSWPGGTPKQHSNSSMLSQLVLQRRRRGPPRSPKLRRRSRRRRWRQRKRLRRLRRLRRLHGRCANLVDAFYRQLTPTNTFYRPLPRNRPGRLRGRAATRQKRPQSETFRNLAKPQKKSNGSRLKLQLKLQQIGSFNR